MRANIGAGDRILRLGLGLSAIAFGLLDENSWRWLGLIGPVLVATALLRVCPAYWLLRIRTELHPGGKVTR